MYGGSAKLMTTLRATVASAPFGAECRLYDSQASCQGRTCGHPVSGIPSLKVNAVSSVKIVLGFRAPYLNTFFFGPLPSRNHYKLKVYTFFSPWLLQSPEYAPFCVQGFKGLGCNTIIVRSGSRESFGTGAVIIRLEEWAAGFP